MAVDEVGFDRNEPGLDEHEQRECDLYPRPAPVILGLDRADKQRPAVLQIGHAGHRDDADGQLNPRIPEEFA
jgi:hypothetical protein